MNTPKSPPELLKRVLFCTDFSKNANFAFNFAIDAANRRPGCKLFLLHVIPESEAQFWKTYIYEVDGVDKKAKHDIDAIIEKNYLPSIPQGMDFQIEVRVGKDHIKILEFARENDIDLIVMGRQGHSTLSKALYGNVTEKIARKADCAVLIIPLSFENKFDDL